MDKHTATSRVYFKNLDMLRFVAAYLIFLLHCYFGWKNRMGLPASVSAWRPDRLHKLELVLHNFSFGVDIFFMISGFLITYLLLRERQMNGKVDVIKFYIRRALRIWPLYFFMILLAPILTYFISEQSPTYLYQFFFLGNFDLIQNGLKSVATNHLWSICIEEHFYLFCPLLVGFIPLKRLPQTLLFLIVGCIVFRAFFLDYTADYGMASYVHTLSRIDILALGALFGYLYFHKQLKFDHSAPVRILIYSIFLLIFFNSDFNLSGSFDSNSMKKYLFALPCAYGMGNLLFHPKPFFNFKESNIFNRMGKVSYGIYMFNPVLIFLTVLLFQNYNLHNFLFFIILVHFLLAVTTTLSYRFIEKPFLEIKDTVAMVKSGSGEIKNEDQSTSIQIISKNEKEASIDI